MDSFVDFLDESLVSGFTFGVELECVYHNSLEGDILSLVKSYGWSNYYDGSIVSDFRLEQDSTEIVTSSMRLVPSSIIDLSKKLYSLYGLGVRTNKTCGLHCSYVYGGSVGVSDDMHFDIYNNSLLNSFIYVGVIYHLFFSKDRRFDIIRGYKDIKFSGDEYANITDYVYYFNDDSFLDTESLVYLLCDDNILSYLRVKEKFIKVDNNRVEWRGLRGLFDSKVIDKFNGSKVKVISRVNKYCNIIYNFGLLINSILRDGYLGLTYSEYISWYNKLKPLSKLKMIDNIIISNNDGGGSIDIINSNISFRVKNFGHLVKKISGKVINKLSISGFFKDMRLLDRLYKIDVINKLSISDFGMVDFNKFNVIGSYVFRDFGGKLFLSNTKKLKSIDVYSDGGFIDFYDVNVDDINISFRNFGSGDINSIRESFIDYLCIKGVGGGLFLEGCDIDFIDIDSSCLFNLDISLNRVNEFVVDFRGDVDNLEGIVDIIKNKVILGNRVSSISIRHSNLSVSYLKRLKSLFKFTYGDGKKVSIN